MTVAVSIETDIRGLSDLGKNQVAASAQGKAQGTGLFSSTTASSSSTYVSQNFRSNWQALLASLGTGTSALAEKDAATTSGNAAAAGSSQIQTIGTASSAVSTVTLAATLPVAGGSTSGSGLAAGQESSSITSTSASTIIDVSNSRAAADTAAVVAGQAADEVLSKSQTIVHTTNPSGKKDETNTSKGTGRETASDETTTSQITTQVTASIDAVAQIAPMPVVVTPYANAVQPQDVVAKASSIAGNKATDTNGTSVLPVNMLTTVPMAGNALTTARSGVAVEALEGTGTSISAVTELTSSRTGVLTETQDRLQTQLGSQSVDSAAVPVVGAIANQISEVSDATSSQSTSALLSVEKSGLASGKQTAEPTEMKSSRGTASVEVTGHVSHSLAIEFNSSSVDASVLTRTTENVRIAENAANEVNGGSTRTSDGDTARETFAALDTDTGTGTPTWIHAGAQQAEAGFQDSTLGWVGVRADVSSGGIHASLVSGTAEAAQMLSGHLAGLNTYLAEQHTPVETLTLATAGNGGSELSADQGSNSGSYQGAGQNSGQGTYADSQQSVPVVNASVLTEVATQINTTTQTTAMGCTHISVMA